MRSGVVTSVARLGTAATRRVTCEIARRDHKLVLQRRASGTLDWVLAAGPTVIAGVIDIAALTTTPIAAGHRIEVDDVTPPDADARYLYRLTVEDPRGRKAQSAPCEEAP